MKDKALNWWTTLSFEEQFYKVIELAKNCDHPHRMKQEDIEQVYKDFNVL
tara:strand:+ start:131 stop:280 length:150 start_codon:yes stop_codon:yes gene_type:complete